MHNSIYASTILGVIPRWWYEGPERRQDWPHWGSEVSGDVDYRDVRLGALRGVWRAVRVFGADQVLIVAVDGVDERRLIV